MFDDDFYTLDSLIEIKDTAKALANELDTATAKYKDYPVICYALKELYQNVNATDNVTIETLTEIQMQFLDAMDSSGLAIKEICERYNLSKTQLIIWQKENKLFNKCVELIKQAEAEATESILWTNAQNPLNPDNISRMFAIKARKPEYRDNALIPGSTSVNIRVTIDGENFDTSHSFKDVTADE